MILNVVNKETGRISNFIAVQSIKTDGNLLIIDVNKGYSRKLIKFILDYDISVVECEEPFTTTEGDGSIVNHIEKRKVVDLAIHYFDESCNVIINNNPNFTFSLS